VGETGIKHRKSFRSFHIQGAIISASILGLKTITVVRLKVRDHFFSRGELVWRIRVISGNQVFIRIALSTVKHVGFTGFFGLKVVCVYLEL
jgi:hypothetical protein